MMKSSSTSFRFSSSLLFFFIVAASIAVYSEAAKKKKLQGCVYTLTVQTGTVGGAGTDSRINVTLGNLLGESVEIPDLEKLGFMMPPDHDYFEDGNLDVFRVTARCMITPVSKITVTSDGSGQNPGWYLEYVKVSSHRLITSLQTKSNFEFSQWLAIDEPPYKLSASRDKCGL